MEQSQKNIKLRQSVITITATVIVTSIAIAGFLIYTGNFDGQRYADYIFYAGLAFITLGGLSAYGSFQIGMNVSTKYASTVSTGGFDNSKRVDDSRKSSSHSFTFKMFVMGILMMAISTVAYMFF